MISTPKVDSKVGLKRGHPQFTFCAVGVAIYFTIMCCIAKIYSSVITARIQTFIEKNDLLADEQNGFRANKSCIDHIFSLVTILRNRKAQGKATFICFIDYKKAFDSVDRNLLLFKLSKIGIVGKVYNAIRSLYKNPSSRVILNNICTDWFQCPLGVKQGDILSPILFAIYINDLVHDIKQTGNGIPLDDDIISCLLYAVDIILLAESETDLQNLLNKVNQWCSKWRLEVNLLKTNVMHVRKVKSKRSEFVFLFEGKKVDYCEKYKYLGVMINETLNFEQSLTDLCNSASRALSGLITKMIKHGGFPLNVYQTLYESCVCSITDYGAEVTGFHKFNCKEKMHDRAIRSFLSVNKHTPIAGLRAEIGWLEPRSRAQLKMIRMCHHLICMPNTGLTKKVILWDRSLWMSGQTQTWSAEVECILSRNNMGETFKSSIFNLRLSIEQLRSSLISKDRLKLKTLCLNLPKLRTYVTVADFDSPKMYLLKPLSYNQRRSMARIRLGCLQLRVETGRFEKPKRKLEDRICLQCSLDKVETEEHFLLECSRHDSLRTVILGNILNNSCIDLDQTSKLAFLLNDSSAVKATAQYILRAFDNRST